MQRRFLLLLMSLVLAAIAARAETVFVSGGSDGVRTYAVIRRNGAEFRTDQMGARYNQKLWEELSVSDRHRLIRAYGWQLNSRIDHFGKATSDSMAAFYNDAAGWTALVDALKARRMAKDYPDLMAVFGPGAYLDIPAIFSDYPEVRDSADFRRASVLAAEVRQDYEIGQKLYQTLTSVKWDQVSIAVKGISGPLIKIIVDNFMTGFITHGSQPMSELVVAMNSFKEDLKQFLAERQNPGSKPPTPADLIERIEKMLGEIERMANLAAANVTSKRNMLEGYAATINEMNQRIREERQERGGARVSALEEQVSTKPGPGKINITGSGPTPYEFWWSMYQQCMAQYNQLMSDARTLESALQAEKKDFLAEYAAARSAQPIPEQVWRYFPATQSQFADVYAELQDTLKTATPWAEDALYAPARNQLSFNAQRLNAASDDAQRFLASALERINALQARAGALDAYQAWMGSWNYEKEESIPAAWTTTEQFDLRDLRNLADVIGVIATSERETQDVADDFKTEERFLDPPAQAFAAGLAERKAWMREEWQRYVSLRFNFENSLSFVLAALTQFDRLHQRPEFKVERTVEIYLVNGKEYPVVVYAVDIPALEAQIAAQQTEGGKQNERLRIIKQLYDLRDQELVLERRLEIAQNAHVADAQDMENWRRALSGRYESGGWSWEYIAADFKQGIGQTLVSQYDLYQNLTGGDPTRYYLISYGEPRWVRPTARCRSVNLMGAIEKISGKTATYYELLDLYNGMEANQAAYLAMSESAFNAFMTDVTKKIGMYPQGSLISWLQVEGVWGVEYPAWRLVMKTQWRQEALNTLYRGMQHQAVSDLSAAPLTSPAALLQRYPGISGRLTTEIGSPVAGAVVRLSGQMAEWTTTAADGSYAFDFLPNGTFVVTPPDGLDFSPPMQVVDFEGTEKTADFVLPDSSANGYTLAGRITDSAGAGVGGVRVQVTAESGAFVADLITGAQGEFSLAGLAAAAYTVRPLDDERLFQPAACTLQVPPSSAEARFQLLGQPAARLLRASGTLAFGEVAVGASAVRTLRLHNDGNAEVRVEGVLCPSGFSGGWRGVLAPGAAQDVSVTFAPVMASAYAGTVTVLAEAVTGAVAVACSGTGVAAAAALAVEPLAFGPVTVGSVAVRSLRLRNSGACAAVVTGITLPAAFGGAWSGVVAAGGSVEVPVTFEPTAVAPYGGTATVALEGGGSAAGACAGEGVAERIPAGWLAARGLPADGSADFSDPDGDGASVFQEWLAGSDPTDTRLDPARVNENQPDGTVVGTLVKPHADPDATYTYMLAAGAGGTDNASFTISGDTLKTAAAFNYEAKAAYTVRVRRTDQNGLGYETPLAVTVGDVNEAPTDITLSSAAVAEQRPRGTTVGEFAAADPDAVEFFSYSLVAGAGDADNESFRINGAVLQTATSVTFTAQNRFNIRVRATDRGDLAYEKAFTISVIDPGSLRNLIVRSAHGGDVPVWTNRHPEQATVRIAMTNTPVRDAAHQYVCIGWTGAGSAPPAGEACDTGPFVLDADSTVTWQWRTNVWLAAAATPGGAVSGATSGWQRIGSPVTLTATPDALYVFVGWSGDTNGCVIAGRTVSATMTEPRALIARFRSVLEPRLEVTPATRAVGTAAGTTTFIVRNAGQGAMPWEALFVPGAGWARITSGETGENDGTVTVAFDANPNLAPARTATLRITAVGVSGSPAYVMITQAANRPIYVLFDPQGGSAVLDQKPVTPGQPYYGLPEATRSGYTFGGWWTASGGAGTQVTEATVVTATADHTLYARWLGAPPEGVSAAAGTAFGLPLPDAFAGAARITVKGLPAGLKYNPKTGRIEGVPTKAGTYSVTISATGVTPQTLTLTVEALPAWAQGAFNGTVEGGGLAAMAVSAVGKVTGKLATVGTNYTFTALSYAAGGSPEDGFRIEAVAKAGKAALPLTLAVTQAAAPASLALAAGELALAGGRGVALWRDAWKGEAAALAPFIGYYTATLPGNDECGSGYLTFTVDKAGKVKVGGKLADGTAASASGTLILDEAGRVFAVVYAAPAAYKGGRLFGLAEFVAPAAGEVYLRPLEEEPFVWQNRSPQATGVFGAGFLRETGLSGGWYSKTANLAAYYAGKELAAGVDPDAPAPALAVGALRYDAIWWDPTGIALTPTLKSGVMAGLAAPAAGKPLDSDKDGVWDYSPANAVGLKVSLTRATGVFKGSFLAWFDYPVKKHVSKSLAFEGALTPVRENLDDGVEGRGYCLWPDKAVPPLPAKPYAFKWSYDFLIRSE